MRLFASAIAFLSCLGGARLEAAEMLRGPHPFLRENELSIHLNATRDNGFSDGGGKILLHYGFKLSPVHWLALDLNLGSVACRQPGLGLPPCHGRSTVTETLGGIAFKFPVDIPLVPSLKIAGGAVYVFPEGEPSQGGIGGRAAGGLTYFFFDWLGVGAAGGLTGAHFLTNSKNLWMWDFGLGAEVQF